SGVGQARRLAGVATVVVVAALAGATAASTSDVATLAFASTRGCSGNSGYGGVDPSDIYVVAADGSGLAQITHDCLSGDPVWSPDGGRIAFVSSRDGMPAVYTMDAGGGDVRRVSQDGVVAWQPSWSRTGRLAYAVDFPAPQRGIWTIAPDGSGAAHI